MTPVAPCPTGIRRRPRSQRTGPSGRRHPSTCHALLDRLPPGVANRLKPAITAPSRNEPGGVARVETARRAVRAEWGAWVDEADARRELIENVDSVMQGLARGALVHEAVRRLERVAHRMRQRVEVEQSPTLGAVARAHQRPASAAVARRQAPRLAVPARTVHRSRGAVLTVPARARGLAGHVGPTCSCHRDELRTGREYHERQ